MYLISRCISSTYRTDKSNPIPHNTYLCNLRMIIVYPGDSNLNQALGVRDISGTCKVCEYFIVQR